MEFRPCIDIHNGKVKQIVGGSLLDQSDFARENFVSDYDASFYAKLYKNRNIYGGHIILLNPAGSRYYAETKRQALAALEVYPKGLQVGGGINSSNALEFIEAGASHVIVTSYVFRDGKIDFSRLAQMEKEVGACRLVLDISCKKEENGYVVVTDRWQKKTEEKVSIELLDELSGYCDEFLIHAVDVEGKAEGVDKELIALLGAWGKKPITYAGGIHDLKDLQIIKEVGKGRIHATIGSALDLFGGNMKFDEVISYIGQDK
ncbi:MAG TPA: phosphoribosylformimino-5-aminoimidazole carboxamide ribotide isomerase [Lachnospiraceae bacterium]|nr:phosphoribosylformimino-5-aminoimidazole carboxamide ribotide isomerase [Lachnospiraceae bacterium]